MWRQSILWPLWASPAMRQSTSIAPVNLRPKLMLPIINLVPRLRTRLLPLRCCSVFYSNDDCVALVKRLGRLFPTDRPIDRSRSWARRGWFRFFFGWFYQQAAAGNRNDAIFHSRYGLPVGYMMLIQGCLRRVLFLGKRIMERSDACLLSGWTPNDSQAHLHIIVFACRHSPERWETSMSLESPKVQKNW